MIIGNGSPDHTLNESEALDIIRRGLEQMAPDGRRLLFIVPDSTRSGPIPFFFRTLCDELGDRPAQLDFLIALGTHLPMDEERICKHFGITLEERRGRYGHVGIYNHNWQEGLKHIGTIPAGEIAALSGGLMAEDVPVEVNSRLFDYDHIAIVGPVFPHEIAGFSGGNKYFFPGVSGPEVIDITHWLAAVITNRRIIGQRGTPVRAVIDRAAALITVEKSCYSMVVRGHDDLMGLYYGTPEESQAAAADLSAQVNIKYMPRTYHTVLSIMPELYDDIWTAGKGMYKLEPVVADGGTVIIYAPHIDEVSYTHGETLDRIGYHVRDYFLAHMEEYEGAHRGVMAHATHVKGEGTYVDGVETPRLNVILASGVPRERCERINLGYMDPATIDPQEYMGREDEGILVVPRAGELLHRLETEE
jgi:nickel-dependent lactate racemase